MKHIVVYFRRDTEEAKKTEVCYEDDITVEPTEELPTTSGAVHRFKLKGVVCRSEPERFIV